MPEILKQFDIKQAIVTDVMHDEEYLDYGITTVRDLTRAVVKVQDGCDRFCTYCIIPYARGKVRSRKPESIINEVKEIAQKGFKEIVITGIHLASYGKDFKEDEIKKSLTILNRQPSNITYQDEKDDLHNGFFRFIDLLEELDKIDGIERIRIGSIEPKWADEKTIERLAKLNKLCHQFHLSLQSGCNETLKRMNRRYLAEDYKHTVELLRQAFNDVILTTDVIVGFPRSN